MKIKQGDFVRAHDLSYSKFVDKGGGLASYSELHGAMWTDSEFNLKTVYKVIATGSRNLPIVSHIKDEDQSIIQDIKTGEIIFIASDVLYPVKVCDGCGTITNIEG